MNPLRTALRPTLLRAVPKARASPILRNIGPMRTYATREKTLRDRSLTGVSGHSGDDPLLCEFQSRPQHADALEPHSTGGSRLPPSSCNADPQPFSWQAAVLFLVTGGGLYYYFQQEKAAIAERKRASGVLSHRM